MRCYVTSMPQVSDAGADDVVGDLQELNDEDIPEPTAIARRSSSYVELEKFLTGLWKVRTED